MYPRWIWRAFALPGIVWLAIFFVVPFYAVVAVGFGSFDEFFQPGEEILVADSTEDAIAALERSDRELQAMARAARERTLGEHTAARRAAELPPPGEE